MKKRIPSIITAVLLLLVISCPYSQAFARQPDENSVVKIFILAGQSNMEGQGVVDLDHPEHYNGGRGTLERVMSDPEKSDQFAHLKDANGNWVERKDVSIRFVTRHGIKQGRLSIGYAGYPGKHHIGPELQFGNVVGDLLDEPVLLIKTAWGGKSLYVDFRPPSADGDTGEYYSLMIQQVREAIDAIDDEFPELKGLEIEFAGFVWFQGWNDMFDETARAEYKDNLTHLIRDVREEFSQPNMPVVIGELGNLGSEAGENMKQIRAAQRGAAEQEDFSGTVRFVETTSFARPKEDSPNVGHGHHWFGNAESYFLIGDALGKGMVELLQSESD